MIAAPLSFASLAHWRQRLQADYLRARLAASHAAIAFGAASDEAADARAAADAIGQRLHDVRAELHSLRGGR